MEPSSTAWQGWKGWWIYTLRASQQLTWFNFRARKAVDGDAPQLTDLAAVAKGHTQLAQLPALANPAPTQGCVVMQASCVGVCLPANLMKGDTYKGGVGGQRKVAAMILPAKHVGSQGEALSTQPNRTPHPSPMRPPTNLLAGNPPAAVAPR